MSVPTPFTAANANQTMSLEAIFLHTTAPETKIKSTCVDQGYWGGSLAHEEVAGGWVTSSLNRAAHLIQSYHGLSYGA